VALIGNDVRMSQFQDFSSDDVECLQFNLVADVSVTADLVLQLDLYDDGTIDYEQPIPSTNWAPVEYRVKLPSRYNGVRFIVHKRGSGEAVIAQIYAEALRGCSEPPLGLSVLPSGGSCKIDDDCATGVCTEDTSSFFSYDVCGECNDDSDCGDAQVCGVESPENRLYDLYRGCGDTARHHLAERCISDAECSTGICEGDICSSCGTGATCDAGRVCRLAPIPGAVQFWLRPMMCSAGQGLGPTGEVCLADADCISGTCTGTEPLKVCAIDGRRCGDNNDCPGLGCLSVGTAGGTCE